MMQKEKIELLKNYFSKKPEVLMAFVFGSQARELRSFDSDWDIAVYFRPYQYGELETRQEYPNEGDIWDDLKRILGIDNVDFLVLNRACPSLVFSILNSGFPLIIRDRRLYLILLIKTHYEAVDYWNFTKEFFEIGERAKSISEEDMAILRQHIRFLENEFSALEKFKKLTLEKYSQDADMRRNVERWIENLVMAGIDIAKIILASEKTEIPQTYRETLLRFFSRFMREEEAQKFSRFAEMRNIVVHEYLDIRWKKIKTFIEDAEKSYFVFIEQAKKYL